MSLQKAIKLNRYFDFYESLLTERQKEVFQYYYHDDLSYHEIAEILNISRAAVYDNLTRTTKILENYETKLGFDQLFDKLYTLRISEVDSILEEFHRGGNNE